MVTPFNRRLGATQGRVDVDGFIPREGDWTFVLGDAQPGMKWEIGNGDAVSIEQTGELAVGPNLLRFRAVVRGPVEAPAVGGWFLVAEFDLDTSFYYPIEIGRTREFVSAAIALPGHTTSAAVLGFYLRFIGDPEELELPMVALDDLIFETSPLAVVLANQVPVPGETAVDVDRTIRFDVSSMAGTITQATGLQVYVDGVLVYNLGVTTAGWGVAFTNFGATSQHRRVVVTPPASWTSLATVTVRVVYETLDSSWSFEVEDLTPPRVASVVAQSLTRVRVTFDETVQLEDAEDANDALNPALYTLGRIVVAVEGTPPAPYTTMGSVIPSTAATALSVVAVSDRAVDVTFDVELSQGAPYTLLVGEVSDAFGNLLAAPYNEGEFSGYTCPAPVGRAFQLWRMIPRINRDEDAASGELERLMRCFQDVVDLLLCKIDDFPNILDPDTAPEQYLDAMLADLGNPFEFDLSETDKRRLVRVLVQIYQQKGTAAGIVNVVRFFLGLEVTINELAAEGWDLGVDELGWDTYLGPGTSRLRYSFEVESGVALTQDQRDRITDIVEYMKPAHTHFIELVEPEIPIVPDHWELGLSVLGEESILH